MKAIQITQELKESNIVLFENYILDEIVRLAGKSSNGIPRTFVSLNHNIGEITENYHLLDDSIHQLDGFYDVIHPDYDFTVEKLGQIQWNEINFIFTFPVIPKTDEEIESELSELKDERLKEMHVLANTELRNITVRINDNDVLRTVGRNEKPIPQNIKNDASSILDQQEIIEEEIQSLTTYQEVLDYVIIFE